MSEARGQGGQAGLEAFDHPLLGWEGSGAGLSDDTGILHGVIPQRVTRLGLYLVMGNDPVRRVKGPRPRHSALPGDVPQAWPPVCGLTRAVNLMSRHQCL